MHHRFLEFSGFVLAGGSSRRMGRPKPQLLLGNMTLLERQVRLLRSVVAAVAVVGPPENLLGKELCVYPDVLPGRGPLGGIFTALLRSRSEFNLILGCDLPFMSSRLLEYLSWRALETGAEVTVPASPDGRIHTLCGAYRRKALKAIRATMDTGENRIQKIFRRVHCQLVGWRELARRGFSPRIFDNMNTPEDYEAARRALGD
jgi:molybdopterin-guanine dinucleotide biosynthesis protein A